MLTLYDYFRSSACFRVRIALHLKNLPYETVTVHLLNQGGEQFLPAYTSKNPQSLVPTLDDNGALLTQSLAIIEYLDELHPEPALLPKHPLARAHVRAFALSIAADLHPLNNLRVLKFLTDKLDLTNDKKDDWYQHWMMVGLAALEKQVSQHHQQDQFCFGSEPTLADICLVPQMFNARRFHCDLSPYPTLVRIDQHCQSLPAFRAAFPAEVA